MCVLFTRGKPGGARTDASTHRLTTSHLYLEPLISRISWVYCLRWYTPRTPGTPAFCGAPYTLIADALSLPEPYPQSTHTTMPTSARQRGQRKRALAKAEQQWRFRDHVRQQFGVISHLEISGYPLYRDHDPMYAHRPTGPRGFYRRSSHYDRARLKALGLDRQYTYAPRFPSGLLESLRANRSSTKDAPPTDGSPEDTSSGDDSSDDPPSDGDDHLATALAEEAANRALEQSLDKLASQPRRPQPRRERPARGAAINGAAPPPVLLLREAQRRVPLDRLRDARHGRVLGIALRSAASAELRLASGRSSASGSSSASCSLVARVCTPNSRYLLALASRADRLSQESSLEELA